MHVDLVSNEDHDLIMSLIVFWDNSFYERNAYLNGEHY